MTSPHDQSIRPVTFLVNDSSKVAVVVPPWGAWLSREALGTTEGRILDGHCQRRERKSQATSLKHGTESYPGSRNALRLRHRSRRTQQLRRFSW